MNKHSDEIVGACCKSHIKHTKDLCRLLPLLATLVKEPDELEGTAGGLDEHLIISGSKSSFLLRAFLFLIIFWRSISACLFSSARFLAFSFRDAGSAEILARLARGFFRRVLEWKEERRFIDEDWLLAGTLEVLLAPLISHRHTLHYSLKVHSTLSNKNLLKRKQKVHITCTNPAKWAYSNTTISHLWRKTISLRTDFKQQTPFKKHNKSYIILKHKFCWW